MEPHFSAIWERVADTVPDQAAVIQGSRTISWREYEQRAARLAQALLDAGLKKDSKVGMYLYNSPEYCETNFAAMKIGAIPINVNYRYLDDELAYLLDNADAEALVFGSSLGDRVTRVAKRLPKLKLLIEVDDGPSEPGLSSDASFVPYEEIQRTKTPAQRITPTGDEHYMLYTGGTTGMPKGVVYSMEEFTGFFMQSYPPMVGLAPMTSVDEILSTALAMYEQGNHSIAMSGPPLMHGTGCWLGMMTPHLFGGTAVLSTSSSFDPADICDAVEANGVKHLIIVGDAFAKPMVRVLEQNPGRWDLSSLTLIISSGAMFSSEVKQALFEHIPQLAIADVLGSTEGGMGMSITTKDTPAAATAKFQVNPTTKILDEDDKEVAAGSGHMGRVANGGLVPIAYYKDPEKSARTFRVVDGVRYSFPGDMGTVEADGSLTFLGRGSNCINTGGEKVFPEEVEEALKEHEAVEDSLVFGQPDDRFGNRVVAVASLAPGVEATPQDIATFVRTKLAAYKLPKELMIVTDIPRHPNGKADYPAARRLLEQAAE